MKDVPGQVEIAGLTFLADKYCRTIQCLESRAREGTLLIEGGEKWVIVHNERVYTGSSLIEAVKVLEMDRMEKMDIGGAKIGACVKCGNKAQLTKNGFCDACCPTGDCEVVAGSEPPPAKQGLWSKVKEAFGLYDDE